VGKGEVRGKDARKLLLIKIQSVSLRAMDVACMDLDQDLVHFLGEFQLVVRIIYQD